MVNVLNPTDAFHFHAFFQQIFMNIQQTATGENLAEFIFQQLIHTRTTRDDHRFNIQIAKRIRYPVEQNTIFGGNLRAFFQIPAGSLRITTAQITRWQYRSRTYFVQHGQCCQTNLAKQTLRTTTGEIEHRIATLTIFQCRIAQNGDNAIVFQPQHSASGFAGNIGGQRSFDELNNLFFNRWLT